MHRRARGPAVLGAAVILILGALSLGFASEAVAGSPQQKPADKKFDKAKDAIPPRAVWRATLRIEGSQPDW